MSWGGVNLFSENQIRVLKKEFDVQFLKKDEISLIKTTETENEKVVVIDPDFIDWKFPNEIWDEVRNLKAVCLATTTDQYVDAEKLHAFGARVLTISNYATQSVAEYLVMLMLCVAKKVPLQLKNQNKQDFSDEFLQIEIEKRQVGVVGLGHIGNRIAEICTGFGCEVSYWDRKVKDMPYARKELPEIFAKSDIIFVTLAVNAQTKKLVDKKLLRSVKETAILISATGFELLDESTVREMLRLGKLYGFGCEVPNLPLDEIEGNAMVTSEYAWFTDEAGKKRLEILFENILKCK